MACTEKANLLRDYFVCIRHYHDAVEVITRHVGTMSIDGYRSLSFEADCIRLECERVRIALKAHAHMHHC